MLFIKNLTNVQGSDIEVMVKTKGEISVSLKIKDNDPITLVKSKIEEVTQSLIRSVETIGTIVNFAGKDDTGVCTKLLSNKVTELSFAVKNEKIILKCDNGELPATLDKFIENDDNKNRFPRDLLIFIVPNKTEDGTPMDCSLVVDNRNIAYKNVSKDTGDYRIIALFIKWPIWMNLKFPAYAYIKDKNTNEIFGAIKLGSKSDSKKVVRNHIYDVDIKEASDYLTESFRLLREKREKTVNDGRTNRFEKKQNPRKDFGGNKSRNTGTDKNGHMIIPREFRGERNKGFDRNSKPNKFNNRKGNYRNKI